MFYLPELQMSGIVGVIIPASLLGIHTPMIVIDK
jgi:hypothetical protein